MKPTHIIRVRDEHARALPSMWPTWIAVNDGIVICAERCASDLIGRPLDYVRTWLTGTWCELVEVA